MRIKEVKILRSSVNLLSVFSFKNAKRLNFSSTFFLTFKVKKNVECQFKIHTKFIDIKSAHKFILIQVQKKLLSE